MLRHVALGDRDEARQARFRGQQVVERVVEPPRAVGVGEPVADREDPAAPVVEHVEPHRRRRAGTRAAPARAACRREPAVRLQRAATHVDDRAGTRRRRRPTARATSRQPRGRAAAARARRRASTSRLDTGGCAARACVTIARASRLIAVSRLRARSPRCARRRRRGEQIGGVGEPCAALRRASAARSTSASQPLRERDQRAGEIAAVDGRDVARMQRRQRRRVVPVEEMSLVALEALERRQRPIEPIGQRLGREVAEIVRRQRREQPHADVGRRGAPRQPRLVAILLVVVGRQPAVVSGRRTSRSSATSGARSGAAAAAPRRLSGRTRAPTGTLSQ